MKRHSGFTLLEIMVVIVIVAVLVGAATLSFQPVGDKLLKEHANRLSALLYLAQDEAILQSTELSIEITAKGYNFYQNLNNSWVALEDRPFIPRQLSQGVSPKLYLDGILTDLEDREESTPQIVILSSGEMTPFVYKLEFNDESTVELTVSSVGEVEMVFSSKDSNDE